MHSGTTIKVRECRCGAVLLCVPSQRFGFVLKGWPCWTWQRLGDPPAWELAPADPRYNVHASEVAAGVHCPRP